MARQTSLTLTTDNDLDQLPSKNSLTQLGS